MSFPEQPYAHSCFKVLGHKDKELLLGVLWLEKGFLYMRGEVSKYFDNGIPIRFHDGVREFVIKY
jgi:hypothetical protein